ncbi:MAG: gamma-glutamyltransferase family protein [Planctomycetes bacterium]|nr:gamma-glutamyltransferase family protein [Planctomycetota bacterium]
MPGMIVAPQPLAVEEGARVLADGGNAFDAALTCAAVQFLLDPQSCGIGGYLVMACLPAGSRAEIVDAPALAGSRTSVEMWRDIVIGANPRGWGYFLKGKVNEDGYQSICTPGMLRGMQRIIEKWGTRTFAEILQPAIRIARDGWMVTAQPANRWKDPPMYYEGSSAFQKLHVTEDAKRIYLKADGTTYEAGETLRNPDYARTLERLAENGPDDFYTGELAREIVADWEAHDGWVTAGDLAGYTVRESQPVQTDYRGYTIVTNPAPHGGPTLAGILNILEGDDLAAMKHNSPEFIYRVSMAMKAAFADRNRHLADPAFEDVPENWLTGKERAAEWQKEIAAGNPIDTARLHQDSPDTTQVTVVDAQGNCVSLTHSLGSSSGAISPGLGFMYNNSMVNFHPLPGHPNSIAPGKGRTTGMTPTLVLKEGRPVLILGAPGATRIITSILQVILNVLDFRMSVSDAVLAPRFDCQGDSIVCQARIPESVCAEVRQRHPIERLPQSHGAMALVHAIAVNEETGELTGAADAGADGMALLVE